MTDVLGDISSSRISDEGGDLLPKMTDVTISTEGSDEQQPRFDSINDFVDLNSGVDDDDDDLPEDEDIFNSSEFGSGSILAIDSASDLEGGGMLNKEEVRKSILKGKSELSRSRQKNNILKAVPVMEPAASSVHSPFSAKPQNRPTTSPNRKLVSSAHGSAVHGVSGPPITEPPQPGLTHGRSWSHDNLAGMATATKGNAGGAGRLFSNPKKMPEEGERSRSHRRASTSAAMRPALQPNSLLGQAAQTRKQALQGGGGGLPAFCTPRRGEDGKRLQVDTNAMLALVAGGGLTTGGGGPNRNLPSRSKSGPLQSMALRLKKPPNRTTSLDGFSLPDVAGRRPRAKSTDDLPESGNDDSSMTLDTKKAWDALAPSPVSLLGGPPEGSISQHSTQQKQKETKNGSKQQQDQPLLSPTKQQQQQFQQQQQQKQKQQNSIEEPSKSKHGSLHSESETDTKDKIPKPLTMDTTITHKESAAKEHSVSTSARHSAHSANSNQSPNSKEEEVIVMWSCWACEYDYNVAEHVFCGMCGTGRDWHCPSCEHDNKSTFNFCGMCGTRKGRVIIHKEQPEAFNMRMRKGTKKKATIKKISNSSRTSSRAPGSPVKSVASTTARSASRRSSAITPRPPKLDTDGMSAASERISNSRRTKHGGTDDSMSAVSERISNSRAPAAENGEQQQPQPSKRSSRGRGREKRESKRGESKTRGESKNRGESKQRSHKKDRTRSTSRVGKDGKERKRNSVIGGGEEKKSSRKHKSSKHKGEKEKARRPRVSASVPPGERPGERKDSKDSPIKPPERPGINRSISESKVGLGERVKAANRGLTADTDDEGGEGSKGKSWLKKTVGLSFAGKTPEESKGILNGELNTTDHSMWRPASEVNKEEQGLRDSVNSVNSTNKGDDVLVTPSIKKRLFKMGGKVGGIPGKLFKSTDVLPPDESNSENRSAEITISRSASGDNLESLQFQKQFQQLQEGGVPSTPSLKKRFLGSVGWGKSQNGKPSALSLDPKPSPAPTATEETLPEADDIVDSDDEEDYPSMDPLEGLSQGLVVTAKDMRPNRPNTCARRKPNPNRDRRRQSAGAMSIEAGFPDRKGHRPLRRTKSGESTGSRQLRRTKNGESSAGRKFASQESDGSSVGGSDNRAHASEAALEDPLGDMSEAESIESLEM